MEWVKAACAGQVKHQGRARAEVKSRRKSSFQVFPKRKQCQQGYQCVAH